MLSQRGRAVEGALSTLCTLSLCLVSHLVSQLLLLKPPVGAVLGGKVGWGCGCSLGQHCPLAMWLWTISLTSLCFRFLTCKMEVRTEVCNLQCDCRLHGIRHKLHQTMNIREIPAAAALGWNVQENRPLSLSSPAGAHVSFPLFSSFSVKQHGPVTESITWIQFL